MTFFFLIALIWIGLGYLVLTRPKYSIFLLIALLPFSALIKTSLSYWLGLDPSQAAILTLWKEVIILWLIVWVIIQTIRNKRLPFRIERVDYLILALFALALISFFFTGLNYQALVFGIRYDFLFLFFYLALKALPIKRDDLKTLLKIIIVTTAMVVIFSIIQAWLPFDFMSAFGYASGAHWEPYQALQVSQTTGEQTRIIGSFSGPNQLGVYLVFVMLFLVDLAVRLKEQKGAKGLTISIIGFLVLLIPIILSFSRTAWVSLAIGLLIYSAIRFFQYSRTKRVIALLIAGLILVAVFWQIISPSWNDELLIRHTDFDRRQRLYQSSQLLIDNPFGLGIGQVGPAAQWRHGPDRAVISENFYLQIGLELGIIGLLVFLATMAMLAKEIFDRFKETKDRFLKSFSLGTFLALIGVLISGLFLHTLTDASLIFSLAILLGLTNNSRLKEIANR